MKETGNKSPQAYWKVNLRIMTGCLAVWAIFGFGASIFFAEALNQFEFFGFKLGFWFAQQGAIVVFVLITFFYAWRMNRLDREFDVHED